MTDCPAIVSVPERAAPLFAATAIITVPLPVPLEPDAIEIHETLLPAVHAHPAEAVTDTEDPVDPVAATEIVDGFVEYEQDAEGWDTVTVCPATVSVPLRAAPVLAEALKATEASPDPFVADVMDNHIALLEAVQAQPVCVSIVIGGPAPPDAATDVVSGVTVYAHATVAA